MRHLRDSWCYAHRLRLTVISVAVAWIITWASIPWIQEDTVADVCFDAAAWVSLLCGVTLRIWATTVIAGRKSRELVFEGPYAFCRNPLYLGTFCLGIALALFLKSLAFSIAIIVLMATYVLGVVPAEEAYLGGKLGKRYLAYCERVPAWLPRWKRYVPGAIGTRNHSSRRWPNLKAEVVQSACWCGLGALAEVTCHFRLAGVLAQFVLWL